MSLPSIHTVAAPKLQAVRSDLARNWQAEAIGLYQQARQRETAALKAELTNRVHALTGREVEANSIYVDLDERFAQVVVDGITFRWRQSGLALLRPCVACGNGPFESSPLHSPADLGYALSAWQPLHAGCQAEDSVGWLYSDY